jgi:hypothetical protein
MAQQDVADARPDEHPESRSNARLRWSAGPHGNSAAVAGTASFMSAAMPTRQGGGRGLD